MQIERRALPYYIKYSCHPERRRGVRSKLHSRYLISDIRSFYFVLVNLFQFANKHSKRPMAPQL